MLTTKAIANPIVQRFRLRSTSEPPPSGPAPVPTPNMVGLYHVAIRLPSDAHVRAAFHRLVDAGVEIVGSSDHGVSHSLYIKDPDGIELELYADVPGWREQGEQVATIRPWDPR